MRKKLLYPNYDEGRIFVSPILGCSGGCVYCYLGINEYHLQTENKINIKKINEYIKKMPQFIQGKHGTIISVGAWGDIFPQKDKKLRYKSVEWICKLLELGNHVQIMSKYILEEEFIKQICESRKYPEQLMYSTTITTIDHWKKIEPNTSPPLLRLKMCKMFGKFGVPSNILLKPFIIGITDNEIPKLTRLFRKYNIDYCVIGILYWNTLIEKKIENNYILKDLFTKCTVNSKKRHLDCNGDLMLNTTSVDELRKYVNYLCDSGIKARLKSSCVSSNILNVYNPSDYYKKDFCIECGNCNKFKTL